MVYILPTMEQLKAASFVCKLIIFHLKTHLHKLVILTKNNEEEKRLEGK